ncbi:hypothetical protein DMA11_18035 [Marinilabiliaceae bacterium JC017]|nr:hypothetical protein DMA11_18035 [Marinilabiliaceae bacterium JC017]
MNFIHHQLAAFAKMDQTPSLKAYHISLYLALFRLWNWKRFVNPLIIHRREVMKMARINSPTTYARAMKELVIHKFIEYEPSYDPEVGSKVNLSILWTGTCPRPVHEMDTINKQINNTHSKENHCEYVNSKEKIPITENALNNFDMKKKSKFTPPPLEHIQIYFQQKNFSITEAERFFNYYESNGWLVGGRSPMKDWKAAARNWMLNIPKFSAGKSKDAKNPRPGTKKTAPNYDEPL